MASFDFEALKAPLPGAEPCGPDLDLADDPEFMQFTARADGLLPESFFAFDRTSVDFDAEFKTLGRLLAQTRDLRLLATLAKLLILNRDLPGFSAGMGSLASLLSEHWEHVHPRGDGDDFAMRMAIIQSLDDTGPVVLPLQHAPLIQSRRLGPISYRTYLLATGEVKPRGEEKAPDKTSIDNVFMEAELPHLIEVRGQLKVLQAALANIRDTWIAKAGFDEAVSFDKLSPVVDKMFDLVDGIVFKRDPSAAPRAEPPGGGAEQAPSALDLAKAFTGRDAADRLDGGPGLTIASKDDAAGALAAVRTYFAEFEPSSPALLLVRQAEQLMGKSFFEVIQALMPDKAEQVTIQIRGPQVFDLSLERMSALLQPVDDPPTADGSGEVVYGVEGEYELDPEPEGEDEGEGVGGGSVASPGVAAANGDVRAAIVGTPFAAPTRRDALALMVRIGDYFRAVEPSSPIPLLTERALSLVDRDFLSLLKDVLPEPPRPEGASQ